MKALFAHDHRFIETGGRFWSESQFDSALWSRYLVHFDALTVVGRRGEMPPGKKLAQLELSSAAGVGFELFPNLSNLRGLIIDRSASVGRLRSLVAEHDVVIARLPSELGLLAIGAARALGRPSAVEVVGCPWDALWNHGSSAGRLYAPIAYLRMRSAVNRSEHAIYVTRSFLQRRYPSRAANQASASNVMLEDVSAVVLDARLARIAAMDDRPLRLGLIGTLRSRYKGIQTLLAALAQSRDDLPSLEVHILGGGDATNWNREAAAMGVNDLVSFDGTLPSGEPVLRWLDGIDVYLQPSLQEGLPRALIEAMSRGCPAIASSVAGIPELLDQDDLIVPGSVRELASLLKCRVADRAWMMQRARRNWSTAQDYLASSLDQRRSVFFSRLVGDAARA